VINHSIWQLHRVVNFINYNILIDKHKTNVVKGQSLEIPKARRNFEIAGKVTYPVGHPGYICISLSFLFVVEM